LLNCPYSSVIKIRLIIPVSALLSRQPLKSNQLLLVTNLSHPKISLNSSTILSVILLTDKQTDKGKSITSLADVITYAVLLQTVLHKVLIHGH